MLEKKSTFLAVALLAMVVIFSVVILFKGGLKEEKPDEVAQTPEAIERAPSKHKLDWMTSKIPVKRAPSTHEIEEAAPEERYKVIDRRGKIKESVQIEKDSFGREIIANELILMMSPGISLSSVENLGGLYGLQLMYYDPATGLAQFNIPTGTQYSRKELQERIPQENASVISAEPNALLEYSALPTEISKNGMWFLRSDANTTSSGKVAIHYNKGTQTLNVPATAGTDIFWGLGLNHWDSGHSCQFPNGSPIIAVIDSGLDPVHPEFTGRFDFGKSGHINCSNNSIAAFFDFETHKTCYEDPGTLTALHTAIKSLSASERDDIESDMSHGLMVSSMIVANNNGQGAVGVCPSGKIMHVVDDKLQFSGGKPQAIKTNVDGYRAIRFAVDNGAKIINASWGSDAGAGCEGYPATCTILQAVRYARAKGAMIIAAAGNANSNIDTNPYSPASLASQWDNPNNEFAHVVTVGGFNPSGSRNSSSNFGAKAPTISAPAHAMASVKYSMNFVTGGAKSYGLVGELDPRIVDPITGYQYDAFWTSGTSFAAPVVSGIAGIIYRKLYDQFGSLNDPQGKSIYDYPKAISTILYETAKKNGNCKVVVGQDSRYGCIDAQSAIVRATNFTIAEMKTLDVSALPSGDLGAAGVTAQESAKSGSGGGCAFGAAAFINTNGGGSGPSGNWPILILYFIPLVLMLRRLVLAKAP